MSVGNDVTVVTKRSREVYVRMLLKTLFVRIVYGLTRPAVGAASNIA